MLARFQHLLVPVDFTAKNRQALDIAFEIAAVNHARVTLLHVIESLDVPVDSDLEAFYAKLEQRARSEMDSLSQRFAAAGLKVDQKIRYGKRLQEIVADSTERKVDLIVMSSHPVDLERPLQSWATLSYQVSVRCPCPVLLVK